MSVAAHLYPNEHTLPILVARGGRSYLAIIALYIGILIVWIHLLRECPTRVGNGCVLIMLNTLW
jgi:hypothetical protein